MKNIVSVLVSLFVVVLMTGCIKGKYKIETQKITQGFFVNKGYTIVAEDESFTLKGGEFFTPPFQNNMYGCVACEKYYLGKVNLLEPKYLLKVGGRKVIVTHGNKKLYGVLVLNKVFNSESTSTKYLHNWNYSTPSLRSYEITIPEERFNNALKGKTELIYEIFAQGKYIQGTANSSKEVLSWILLLSRNPF